MTRFQQNQNSGIPDNQSIPKSVELLNPDKRIHEHLKSKERNTSKTKEKQEVEF